MAKPNLEFIKSEFTDSTFRTIHVNAILLISASGQVVALKTLEDNDRRSLTAEDLLFIRQAARKLVGPIPTDSGVTGIVSLSTGSVLFSARPILTSEHHGPSRDTLVMARLVDTELVNKLSNLLNIPITMGTLDAVTVETPKDGLAIERSRSDEFLGNVVFRGPEGEPALVLRAALPLVIKPSARRAQWVLVGILLFIATGSGLAKLMWLERRVLLPIADLSRTIKHVTEYDDLTKRAPIRRSGRNELAMLTVRINLMLDRLQKSREELVKARTSLEHQANHDGLTGALNQAAMRALFTQELARARREARPLAALMIDVDHFKEINDSYGHETGDEVLKALVQEIRKVLRPYDSLGRYGGEEFLVLASNADNDSALMIAERIRYQIASNPLTAGRHLVRVTVSIGAASGYDLDAASLIRAADEALYASKRDGRNKVSLAALPAPTPRLVSHGVN